MCSNRTGTLRSSTWGMYPWDGIIAPPAWSTDETATPSKLCTKCEAVRCWIQDFYQKGTPKTRTDKRCPTCGSACDAGHEFGVHGSDLEIRESAEGGCHLCTIVTEYLPYTCPHTITLIFTMCSSRDACSEPEQIEIRGVKNDDDTGIGTGIKVPVRRLEASTIRSWPSTYSISTRSIAASVTAKSWLSDCFNNHSRCRERYDIRFMPKRLIEIGPSGLDRRVRIIETQARKLVAPYAALSYCWGGNAGVKLTSLTKARLSSDGISLKDLSRTVQDAIWFASQVGFQYIWVDALCIVQDDQSDWAMEAASMMDVYSNSTVTIAAVSAHDNDEGLFSLRDPLGSLPCWLHSDSKGREVHVIAKGFGVFYDDHIQSCLEPLHKRGWALQERLLPPRTINFRQTLSWECLEAVWSDLAIGPLPPMEKYYKDMYELSPMLKRKLYELHRFKADCHQTQDYEEEVLEAWDEIVHNYSHTELTVVSDRLVALQGITNFFQEITNWTNIYGLWKPFLATELLWFCYEKDESEPTQIAPTWSWASLNVGVWPYGASEHGPYPFMAHIEPAPRNDFALSVESYLLGGQDMRHILLSYDGSDARIDANDAQAHLGRFHSFLDRKHARPPEFSFVPLVERLGTFWKRELRNEGPYFCVEGLLIKRSTSVKGTYERIGAGCIDMNMGIRLNDLLCGEEKHTIFLV